MAGGSEGNRGALQPTRQSKQAVLLYWTEVGYSEASQSYVATEKGSALIAKLKEIKNEFEAEFSKKGADINVCGFSGTQKGQKPSPEGLSNFF